MSNWPQQFGAVLREARRALGWSQEQLAAAANVDRTYLGEIERSSASPTLASLEKLAVALNVDASELLKRCELRARRTKSQRAGMVQSAIA